MNQTVEALVQQARKLKPEDRAALVDALCDLDAPSDPEWEAAWIKECEDRIAAMDRGEMEAVDFNVAMEELRRKYGFK